MVIFPVILVLSLLISQVVMGEISKVKIEMRSKPLKIELFDSVKSQNKPPQASGELNEEKSVFIDPERIELIKSFIADCQKAKVCPTE